MNLKTNKIVLHDTFDIFIGAASILCGISMIKKPENNINNIKALSLGLLTDKTCKIVLFFIGLFFIIGGLIFILIGIQRILR